ncbi:MAG: TldD/PmbA family protein [Planctomycetes bacterium]|nr:TldD/PmbA family protein [Planctomycetota bacterium]
MALLELAQEIVDEARKAGADFADASVGNGRHISVEVESGSIRSTEVSRTESLAVRAFVKGGRGTISVSGIEALDVSPSQIARQAVEMAKAADPDPDFVSLPPFEEADEVEGLYDERLEAFTPSEAVEAAGRAVDEAKAVDSDAIVMADVSVAAGEGAIANSLGVAVSRKSSSIDHGVFVVIRRGADTGAFYDFDAGRNLSDVDLAPVAKNAAQGALAFLGARKVETRPMPVVLGPLSAYSFIKTLAAAANAESIQRKRSYLVGRLGEVIGSRHFTLVDNALVPRGLSSGVHDGEGARRREVTIYDEGRLANVLHNSYTAGKAGVPNTGHATRGGGIAPTNVFLRLGDKTAAEIISEVDEGLYINMGSLAIHPTSGDISTSVDFGYKIEKGRLAYPVANAMVAGDIFGLLEALDTVSSDYRSEPGAVMPTIRIAKLDVAGG